MAPGRYRFHPIVPDDLPMVRRWLKAPHVARAHRPRPRQCARDPRLREGGLLRGSRGEHARRLRAAHGAHGMMTAMAGTSAFNRIPPWALYLAVPAIIVAQALVLFAM